MHGLKTMVGILALTACLASSAAAKIPDVEIVQSSKGHWLVCPAGDGPSLQESGVAVTLQLSSQGAPLQGFPWQDLWLSPANVDPRGPCILGAVNADASSDLNGMMTITGVGTAGGYSQDGLVIWASGIATNEYEPPVPLLNVRMNSPDITDDGAVDLSDVAEFAQDMLDYDFRSDLQMDGDVNLADLAILVEHLGHRCP